MRCNYDVCDIGDTDYYIPLVLWYPSLPCVSISFELVVGQMGEERRVGHGRMSFLDDYDTIVECPKCGKRQHLMFYYGLKNGWSKCCGDYTMPIVECKADIKEAIKRIVEEAKQNANLEAK